METVRSSESSKKLILKPVGIRIRETKDQESKKKKMVNVAPVREKGYFVNEVVPSRRTIEVFNKTICYKKHEERKFKFIEDPRESNFSHCKFILLEKILFILTLFYLCLSIIKTEIDMMESPH